MSEINERKNPEHYTDLTPYEALKSMSENANAECGASVRRGDVYYIKANNRPAIIVSNNTGNKFSQYVEIVYLTRNEKRPLPTHAQIWVAGVAGSTALCEDIHTIHKDNLENYVGTCTAEEMREVGKALAVSLRAKDFLKQVYKLDRMVENKLAEKRQWQEIATGSVAQSTGERVQSSGNPQKMADAIGRYIDIEREIDMCIDKLVDAKRDVISVIEQLSATEYDILHKMYVQFMTLDDVAARKGKSYSWITTMHGRALKNVQKILDSRDCPPVL